MDMAATIASGMSRDSAMRAAFLVIYAEPRFGKERAKQRTSQVAVVDKIGDGVFPRNVEHNLVAREELGKLAVLINVGPCAARSRGQSEKGCSGSPP